MKLCAPLMIGVVLALPQIAAAPAATAADPIGDPALWLTTYRHSIVCDGGVCAPVGDGVARVRINGDHFTLNSPVDLVVRRPDGETTSFTTTARPLPGFVAGAFSYESPVLDDCDGTTTSHIQALDGSSNRWSAEVPVVDACGTA
ncbi:hypothetical protein FK531_04745 [Rhodococcus spelaei]|uniref:Secreted protein n=1 Tax=Rhodococcus spelaei TaxID=2546320 RepID=A0A541BP05_9NOCA|nr:hypothetical protein [Rhodococcus spelaei]TQF73978.1 hypothetical protein FK531_04745 [Rhodococcus spelaei]